MPSKDTSDERKRLLESLNQSHAYFVQALLDSDENLALISYTNYVTALAVLLNQV